LKYKKRFEWFAGFIIGIMAPLFGAAVFISVFPALRTVTHWDDPAWQLILLRLSTFSIGLNALLFFFALRMDKESVARGILWASALFIVPVAIMQFF
jgi:hypothetical protein